MNCNSPLNDFKVQSILECIPRHRQTLLFSATIPPAVEKISSSLLINPVWISVGAPSAPNMDVKQVVLWVDDKSKKKRLFTLLQDHKYFTPPILVFVDSKMGADLLAEAIQKVGNYLLYMYMYVKLLLFNLRENTELIN